jgi:hypothetical protein
MATIIIVDLPDLGTDRLLANREHLVALDLRTLAKAVVIVLPVAGDPASEVSMAAATGRIT